MTALVEAIAERHPIYHTLSVGACSVCFLLPAVAEGNAAEMIFGFSQSFEADDNLGLDPVSLGDTAFASTALSAELSHETPLDRFQLAASGVLRAVDGPGAETGIDEQRLELGYSREGAQAAFGANASYFRSSIEFLRPLEDFENEAGEIELPSDLEDLNGTGKRDRYQAGFTAEFGQEGPAGAAFSGDYQALRYSDTNDPGLFDNERSDLGAELFLRFTPLVKGSLGADYRLYSAEDDEETRRETRTGYFGLSLEVSPILRFEAQLGYTTIDTREFGVVTQTQGPEGYLRLERDMPNGTVGAEVERIVTEDADIHNFRVSRGFDLPNGPFAFSIGVADSELDSAALIGSLDWRRDLPSGEMGARLDRSLGFDEEDGNILKTALFLDYVHDINAVSGITLNAGYAISDQTDDQIDQGNIMLSYHHAVAEDWALRLGYRYRMREETAEPRAQSHSVFFTLGRDFTFRL